MTTQHRTERAAKLLERSQAATATNHETKKLVRRIARIARRTK